VIAIKVKRSGEGLRERESREREREKPEQGVRTRSSPPTAPAVLMQGLANDATKGGRPSVRYADRREVGARQAGRVLPPLYAVAKCPDAESKAYAGISVVERAQYVQAIAATCVPRASFRTLPQTRTRYKSAFGGSRTPRLPGSPYALTLDALSSGQ
jgi:hypothetical protein